MASAYATTQHQPQQQATSSSATASVPATPHNQTKAKAGPVPDLISALREDNRALATALLRLDPTATSSEADADADAGSKPPPVSWRQRLVFANDSVRNLVLRHVLGDDKLPTKAKKKKKQQTNRRGGGGGEEDDSDLPIPRGLGIVGTRLLDSTLTPNGRGDGGGGGGGVAHQTALLDSSPSGVDDVDVDPRDETDGADVVCYFLRPDARQTRSVCRRVRHYSHGGGGGGGNDKIIRHRIVYIPHGSALTDRILLDTGVLPMDSVTVHSIPIDFVPLDADVLSLERPEVVRRADVEGTPSDPVAMVARSLVTLQDVTGVIGRVQCLGPMAEAVLEKMMAVRMDDAAKEGIGGGGGDGGGADAGAGIGLVDSAPGGVPAVDAMMIIDRKVDMVTPMLTPLTYEGLLDEVLGIDCGLVRVDADVIEPPEEDDDPNGGGNDNQAGGNDNRAGNSPPATAKMVALPLSDADTLYAEVRDQHVEKFGSFLKSQAKALKETHSDFTTNKGRDLTEIHQFVKQIPIFTQNLRSLTHHILLAELVKASTEESDFRQRWQTERSMVESEACYETLEDLIACQEPPYRLLRLLCLQSLTGGGIKSSKFDSLRREVVQTYGYEFVFILNNLEKAGLLRRRETQFLLDSSSPFATLRKLLRLINAEVNTADPDDVSYVSSGYAPLTARLVEIAATIGWAGKDEALRELPGRLVDVTQRDQSPDDLASAMKRGAGPSLGALARERGKRTGTGGKKPVLLVYFVGGVTFMEIAALRFLCKRPSFPYSIVICTTKIISGRTLLQSLS